MASGETEPKPVRWVGSSRDDLRDFPEPVRLRIGGALWEAQLGRKAGWAKPLKGFAGAVYVLHAFQKKSRRGIATPRHEIALIEQRLKRAKEDYDQWLTSAKAKSR